MARERRLLGGAAEVEVVAGDGNLALRALLGPIDEDAALARVAPVRRFDATDVTALGHRSEELAEGERGFPAQARVAAVAGARGDGLAADDVDEVVGRVGGRERAEGRTVHDGQEVVAVDEGGGQIARGDELREHARLADGGAEAGVGGARFAVGGGGRGVEGVGDAGIDGRDRSRGLVRRRRRGRDREAGTVRGRDARRAVTSGKREERPAGETASPHARYLHNIARFFSQGRESRHPRRASGSMHFNDLKLRGVFLRAGTYGSATVEKTLPGRIVKQFQYFTVRASFAFEGNRPPFKGRRPLFKGNHPLFKGNHPPFKGNRPPFKGNHPPFKGRRPLFKGRRPLFKGRRPLFKGRCPLFKGRCPLFKGRRPPFKGRRPPFKGRRPPFKGERFVCHGRASLRNLSLPMAFPPPRISGGALRQLSRFARTRPGAALMKRVFLADLGIRELANVPEDLLGDFPISNRPVRGRPPRAGEDLGLGMPTGKAWAGLSASFTGAYRSRTANPREVVDRALAAARKLAALAPSVGPLMAYLDEEARREAALSDARYQAGAPLGPLDGVPFAVKEETAVRGLPRQAGSSVEDAAAWAKDATCVARLRATGAIVLGHTPMTEYGMTPLGLQPEARDAEATLTRPTALPAARRPGSGVAVATGLVPFAIGCDGGGSIRIPSALCGVFGIKPTFGRMSRAGDIAGGTVAHVGPLASSTIDLARFLEAVGAADPEDPETEGAPPIGEGSFVRALGRGVRGLRHRHRRARVERRQRARRRRRTRGPARAGEGRGRSSSTSSSRSRGTRRRRATWRSGWRTGR